MIDSYLGDELLVETNHEVLRHLENCAACRAEIAARRELRERVRSAIRNSAEVQINPAFASGLQSNLRETALRPNAWEQFGGGNFVNFRILAFAAACLVIVSLAGAVWLKQLSSPSSEKSLAENDQSNQSKRIPQPVESPTVQAVEIAWREIAHSAIGDHKNCAVKFRLAEKPISLTKAAEKFGRFNKDLDTAVTSALRKTPAKNADEKIEFVAAHSCVFHGRRFAHVVLKYRNRLVSILVTNTDLPANDGETITSQLNDGEMSVASFQAAHETVFIISDLSETDNLIVAQTVSSAVRAHIERAEA